MYARIGDYITSFSLEVYICMSGSRRQKGCLLVLAEKATPYSVQIPSSMCICTSLINQLGSVPTSIYRHVGIGMPDSWKTPCLATSRAFHLIPASNAAGQAFAQALGAVGVLGHNPPPPPNSSHLIQSIEGLLEVHTRITIAVCSRMCTHKRKGMHTYYLPPTNAGFK